VTTTYQEPNALGRATLQPSRAKSVVRAAIHLLSYYFILKRRRAAQARVAGFRLIVRPTVFHPRYFLTSAFFAQFVSKLDLSGKKVADVGTGSGILALAAAQGGAATVLALDINPNAAEAAAENAYANGFGGSISAMGSNLLADPFTLAPESIDVSRR
jgi:release factor glutamine methyltransferase